LWVFDTADSRERRGTEASEYGVGPCLTVVHESELSLVDLVTDEVRKVPVGEVDAATIDPTGTAVAFVRDRGLWVVDVDNTHERVLAESDG
jgi:tricorn protease-like protein